MPKQFSFVVEVAISEDGLKTIIIREPQRGGIVKITSNPEDVASFLQETAEKVCSSNAAGNHE